MNLLLDCGNSRLKWATAPNSHRDSATSPIIQRGICDYNETALTALCTTLAALPLHGLRFASVIGAEREQLVFARLQPLQLAAQRFTVSAASGTLRNAYATPETLGVDRWAAAIGAWGRVQGPCLIVSTGTATTIDLIDVAKENDVYPAVADDGTGLGTTAKPDVNQAKHQGVYRGGLILPGIDLMLQSLHSGTARLPQSRGHYRAFPEIAATTHDAIASGVIEATCGAIERMARRLPNSAPWLITGGAATPIAQAMHTHRLQRVDDLVLEGLA